MFVVNIFKCIAVLISDLHHIFKTLIDQGLSHAVRFSGFYINIWGKCVE